MPEIYAVGTFSPVVYYESPSGKISLPGTAEDSGRGHGGWIRKEARSLPEVDELQKRIDDQDRRELRGQLERDELVFEEKRKKVRESLLGTLTRSSTTPYEKEFIREYLSISDVRKRKYYQKDKAMKAYFIAREYDDGGAKLIEE